MCGIDDIIPVGRAHLTLEEVIIVWASQVAQMVALCDYSGGLYL